MVAHRQAVRTAPSRAPTAHIVPRVHRIGEDRAVEAKVDAAIATSR
ncbi:hypothetical protein RMDY18_15330 [Rothia mucilaginosa DY-18]|uniref:Uncharacterized protein n=1 Tax=Rothia mucilaginosa (strain DY-18) TaxID=680646 RepID=D2NNZ7_ROTMD|nr:hypothetical protein RMDY18_15330 [Rothia mucilaginosa DY-18]